MANENYTRELEQEKYNQLYNDCRVFWAFDKKQFEKNKTPLKKDEKYASIGAGGYLPKSKVDNLIDGMNKIEQWAKTAKKNDFEVILYELNNYESFYTGNIENALDRLKDLGYTREQVMKVYRSPRGKKLTKAQV